MQEASTTTIADHKVYITQKLQLEFLVKENEQDTFKSIPVELAKPLVDSPSNTEKRTYLVEVKPDWFFGLRMHSVYPLPQNTGYSALVLIDNIPTRTENRLEYLTPTYNQIICSIRGDIKGYPLQFVKSSILQDPSELRNSTRKDVSVVGKIELKFYDAKFSHVGPSVQYEEPIPVENIKIKESQSKDKGICAVASTPIRFASSSTSQYWDSGKQSIAEIVILYRDAIGMITEKGKRGMLDKPPIKHTNIMVEVSEEDEEPPKKKIKKETVVLDLDAPKSQSSSHPIIIDLESEDTTQIIPVSNSIRMKPEPLSAKAKHIQASWSTKDVQDWLKALDSSIPDSIVMKFEQEDVNGKVLFSLNDEDLKNVFEISTLGKRKIILDGIQMLRNS